MLHALHVYMLFGVQEQVHALPCGIVTFNEPVFEQLPILTAVKAQQDALGRFYVFD